jgi:site-specific recombinase XerD
MNDVILLRDRDLLPSDRNEEAWRQLKALALEAVTSPHSKRAYEFGLDDFRAFQKQSGSVMPAFTKAAVNAYRAALEARGLAPATINVRLSAIRRLVAEAADNGLTDAVLAAGVARVKGVKRHGTRLGNWLSKDQAEALLAAPDPNTTTGKRDRAVLAVLVGCGLRRSEAAALTIEHVQQREGRWLIADLVGKHGRVRSVPMPSWAKGLIDEWTAAAKISTGHIFRPVNKGGRITGGRFSTAGAVWVAVQKYADAAGVPELAPHDLRRTYAKLAHRGRAALEQIQLSLGHASIQTTERYLGVQQDLQDAPCDHLGLRVHLPAA